ncbi:hypothetical protein NH340_JMT08076 [Sarcoptes scabiei]|nr:hypothetical protein NH340_JMT08076 [Sarcoptes scabiei]
MAYVNVAEWTPQHVGDWLYGLDDSILPYVQFFVTNQINGCRLLLLTAQDLIHLNIHKIGHQEIILEAVELLRNLHYNITSETLQTIALRLACKSRALFNTLKKSAEKAAAEAAAIARSQENGDGSNHGGNNHNHFDFGTHRKDKKDSNNRSSHRFKEKDKDKDRDGHHRNQHGSQPNQKFVTNQLNLNNSSFHYENNNCKTESQTDLSPVSTATLYAVSDILSAVKDFISWIDRYPFDRNDRYLQTRKTILQLSIELTSTAQRDQFVQGPNEIIKKSCKELADICDRLVQQLNDSLAIQAASLDVVIVTKNMDEDLGMHIHSSYSGIHVVGGLKYQSPAHLNRNIEEGDEIVQVNYQTVVGWQLKKLVASMRRFPTKLILTVKKRPRHYSSDTFSNIPQFSLPLPEVSIISNSSLPLGNAMNIGTNIVSTTNAVPMNVSNDSLLSRSQSNLINQTVLKNSSHLIPLNNNNSNITINNVATQEHSRMNCNQNQNIDSNCSNSFGIRNSLMSTQSKLSLQQSNDSKELNKNSSTSSTISNYDTLISQMKNFQFNPDSLADREQQRPSAMNNAITTTNTLMPNQRPSIKTANNCHLSSDGDKEGGGDCGQNRTKLESFDADKKFEKYGIEMIQNKSIDRNGKAKNKSNNRVKSKNVFARSRIATTRCSSASDSPSLSDLSDSSTMFLTDDDDDDDDDDDEDDDEDRIDDDEDVHDNNNNSSDESDSNHHRKSIASKRTSPRTKNIERIEMERSASSVKCQTKQMDFIDDGRSGIHNDDDLDDDNGNDNDSACYSTRASISVSDSSRNEEIGQNRNGACSLSSSSSCRSSSTNSRSKPEAIKNRFVKQKNSLQSIGQQRRIESETKQDTDEECSQYCSLTKRAQKQKPRTSAEFEELFLKKSNGAEGDSNLNRQSITSNDDGFKLKETAERGILMKSSTIDANQSENAKKLLNELSEISLEKKGSKSLSSLQLSTITHLTSLAENIRFANTTLAQIRNCDLRTLSPRKSSLSSPLNSHYRTKTDQILAEKIESAIQMLSDGDLVIGNHEGFLYTYKASDRIGGNHPEIPSSSYIRDAEELNKWTRLRSVLQDNCLYSYLNGSKIASFEIPIHLPGYYILVDKEMFLEAVDLKYSKNSNLSNGVESDEQPKQLVVFKLVTYHRLFVFAVESLRHLTRWIARCGYRFCCNPSERQLCFTYYLSSSHSNVAFSPNEHRKFITNINHRDEKDEDDQNQNQNQNDHNDVTDDVNTLTKGVPKSSIANEKIENESDLKSISSIQLSEFESDDYHELLSNRSSSNDQENFHVKFNEPIADDVDSVAKERFIRTPHPRGSIKFAVKPPSQMDFIDSTIDVQKTLKETIEKEKSTIETECDDVQKSYNKDVVVNVKLRRDQKPPELPPRTSNLIFSSSSSSSSQLIPNDTNTKRKESNEIESNVVPLPKPRISKMAITTTASEFQQRNSQRSSPSKTSNIITSAAQRLAPTPPMPERSTSISQTIQHFANLQRENNLRRSFAQQQQQQQQQQRQKLHSKQNSIAALESKTVPRNFETSDRNGPAKTKEMNKNSCDYDFVINRSTKSVYENFDDEVTNQNGGDKSPPPALNTIGNPLYCHLPKPITIKESSSLQSKSLTKNQIDEDGLKMNPNVVCEPSKSVAITDDINKKDPSESYIASKPNQQSLSRCNKQASSLADRFESNQNFLENSPKKEKLNNRSNEQVPILTAPPKPNRNDIRDETPPTLLPRRSAALKEKIVPPPLPPIPPIQVARMKKNSSLNQRAPIVNDNDEWFSSDGQQSNISQSLQSSLARNKILNRSFSDAAYENRAKDLAEQNREMIETNGLVKFSEENIKENLLSKNDSILSSKSSLSHLLNDGLASPLLNSPSSNELGLATMDISPSNRSLPTMGVLMLGKKRLSNVSVDGSAIEKAIHNHNRQTLDGGDHWK